VSFYRKEVEVLPNIKSAKKRVIVNGKRAMRNQMVKSNLRTTLKKFDQALKDPDASNIDSAYRLAVKKLDQAAAKKVIHKNAAANKKSQIALSFKRAQSQDQA